MADIAADLNNWSSTPSSNQPTDSTTIGSGLSDNLTAIQAVVRGYLAAKGTDIASSLAPDVAAVQGLYHDVTGNVTITGLGTTATAGIWKILQFDGSPVLKNSTALAMVGARDVTATPGAVGVFICEASNQWRNLSFNHSTAGAVVQSASSVALGVVELATNTETLTGTDTERAVTPSALASVLGMVKLSSGNASATATCEVSMASFTGYRNKRLVASRFLPATDSVSLLMRFSTDGGSTYDAGASDYGDAYRSINTAGTTADSATAGASVRISNAFVGNAASEGISAIIDILDTTNAAALTLVNWRGSYIDNSGFITNVEGTGGRATAQDTDAVQLRFSSGNITSGTWVLYGYG